MEIFAGFSIRPRSTPYPTPKRLTERVEKGSLLKFGPDSGFAILFQMRKEWAFFERSTFEQ
jgi:hypothetical protein